MYVGKQCFYCGSVGVEIDSCEQKDGSRGKLTAVREEKYRDNYLTIIS